MSDRPWVWDREGAMLKPQAFLAGRGAWGLFTSGPSSVPADPTHELETVHVDDLEQSLQFARVTLTVTPAQTSTGHVVVSAYPPLPADRIADAVHRLLPICAPAALCMVVHDRTGWAKVAAFGHADPESIAAAVAHTKITGGWDETDPIVVEIDELRFEVSGEFSNEAWQLVVRQRQAR
jgi:hypothetical protein